MKKHSHSTLRYGNTADGKNAVAVPSVPQTSSWQWLISEAYIVFIIIIRDPIAYCWGLAFFIYHHQWRQPVAVFWPLFIYHHHHHHQWLDCPLLGFLLLSSFSSMILQPIAWFWPFLLIIIIIIINDYSSLVGVGLFLVHGSCTQSVAPWTRVSLSQQLWLRTVQHLHSAHKHPCLEWHSNPRSVFERAKAVHFLDRPATSTHLNLNLSDRLRGFRRSSWARRTVSTYLPVLIALLSSLFIRRHLGCSAVWHL
jgi:hypothetical protein